MGFMTNISILNDHFDWIDKNPKTFVKAIKYGMNSGTDSYVDAALAARQDRPPHWHESPEERQARVHYVTVHRAQHMDVPQVAYAHQNMTFDVYDLARGFELDSPKINKYTPKVARDVAKELRRQAKYLDNAVNEYEKRQETD